MPERIDTDVLVVGAGPGGSAAAYHLARHGIDVTAVDKASFPREKVCGDGLTPRSVGAVERMGVDTSDPGFERVIGLRVHSKDVTMDLPWPELETWPDYGLVMPRLGFDHILLEQAKKAGARVMEATDARAAADQGRLGRRRGDDARRGRRLRADARSTRGSRSRRTAPRAASRLPPASAATTPGPSGSPRVATTAPRTSAGRGSSPGSTSGRATCSSPATAGSSRWPTAA